jgi:hypothetical protein
MPEPDDPLARLHHDLGLKPLRPLWAKLEILLGLTAAAVGLFAGMHLSHRPTGEVPPWAWVGPVALVALGGYLALAGHRSHLYQSNNRLTAYLAELTRSGPKPRDNP